MPDDRKFGAPVPGWRAPPLPGHPAIAGRTVRLGPLTDANAPILHAANGTDAALWDYLPYGPFTADAYADWVAGVAGRPDPAFLVVTPVATGTAAGVASLMRISPEAGSIEVGHICLSPALQRSVAASEAIFLLASHVFALGYRRFEWKCDACNMPSRRAAQRFGFSYEGVFRQAAVIKGRNRDTAWFAMTNGDWSALHKAWRDWLAPENFDAQGQQRTRLSAFTAPHLAARDPLLDPA